MQRGSPEIAHSSHRVSNVSCMHSLRSHTSRIGRVSCTWKTRVSCRLVRSYIAAGYSDNEETHQPTRTNNWLIERVNQQSFPFIVVQTYLTIGGCSDGRVLGIVSRRVHRNPPSTKMLEDSLKRRRAACNRVADTLKVLPGNMWP